MPHYYIKEQIVVKPAIFLKLCISRFNEGMYTQSIFVYTISCQPDCLFKMIESQGLYKTSKLYANKHQELIYNISITVRGRRERQ